MRKTIGVIGVFIIIAIFLFIATKLFYPPQVTQSSVSKNKVLTSNQQLPLKCAIIISDVQKGVSASTSLSGTGHDVKLFRPVGEMLSVFLPVAAHRCFREVQAFSHRPGGNEFDIIIELYDFSMSDSLSDWDYKLPFLVVYGNAYVSLSVNVLVSGPKIAPYHVQDAVGTRLPFHVVWFPLSRMNKSLTEAAEFSAETISNKIIATIAYDFINYKHRTQVTLTGRVLNNCFQVVHAVDENKKIIHSLHGKCLEIVGDLIGEVEKYKGKSKLQVTGVIERETAINVNTILAQ